MKVSLIATVLNEEKTIREFLESIVAQTRFPDEVVIADGGSTDATLSVISNKYKRLKVTVITKPGNRSVGRNEAIKHATGNIIVCTDGDCILDKNWVRNIIRPFIGQSVDVVAGYYRGRADNLFQKCLVPYVLVMEERVVQNTFLPASRTMAFRKSIWKSVGGFPEEYSHNEDHVFAKRLKKLGAKIVFTKDAIVYWRPRKDIKQAFTMFFRFAYGDAEAGIIRWRALFIFFRYFLGILLLIFSFFSRSLFLIEIIILCLISYLSWSIQKNYRYIKNKTAFFWLPILQLTSDSAVLLGSLAGTGKRVWDIQKKQ